MDRMFMPFVSVVRLVVTHLRPHLDELAAWWLALRFGESIFPGITKAVLKLVNAGTKLPDGRTAREWKEKDGALLLGIGGAKSSANPDGAEFDEHGIDGESTMTLMAKALGLTTDPMLRDIIDYTHRNDRKGNSVPWDAASLLKCLNAFTVNTMQVAQMYFEQFDAHYARRFRNDPTFTNDKHATLFDAHLAQWLWENFSGIAGNKATCPNTSREVFETLNLKGREELGEIEKLAFRDHSKGCCTPFDIVTIFSELVENGADTTYQCNFVSLNMNAKYSQQRRFMQALDEVRTKAVVTWVGDPARIKQLREPRTVENSETLAAIAKLEEPPNVGDPEAAKTIAELRKLMVRPPVVSPNAVVVEVPGIRPVQVIATMSDNEEVIKAMRIEFPSAHFYVRRQGTKHTVINGPKPLMDSVCAEVRIGENIRRNGHTGPKIPTEHLRQPGNIPEDDVWTYHKEGGQMLNGSLTSPGTPHTLLTLEVICRSIGRALNHQARFDRAVRLNNWKRPPRPGSDAAKAVPDNHRKENRNNHPKGTRPAVVQGTTAALNTLGSALIAAGLVPTPVPPVTVAEPVIPEPVIVASPAPETVIEVPSEDPPAAPAADAPKRTARAGKPRTVRKTARPKPGKGKTTTV
jgi:hypothetical protein